TNAAFALKPEQIVLVGERADPSFAALRRAVDEVSLPNRIVLAITPGQPLPPAHPAFGKGLVGGRPAAYVCEGPVCSLPLIEAAALRDHLSRLR
ncbi:MAG: thioredoxin domain-containing protein, partial [Alphaproteobacteria bacterium]